MESEYSGEKALIAEVLITGIADFYSAKRLVATGKKPQSNFHPPHGDYREPKNPSKTSHDGEYNRFFVSIQEVIDWIDYKNDSDGLSMKFCCEALGLDPEKVYWKVVRGGTYPLFKKAISARNKRGK